MTIDEMKLLIQETKKEQAQKERMIRMAFAKSNNSINIGDIVEDHIGKLKVETIQYAIFLDPPCAVYFGKELLKSGKEAVRQIGRGVYQYNLISK